MEFDVLPMAMQEYGNLVVAHKAHAVQADMLALQSRTVKILSIFINAVTATGIASSIFVYYQWVAIFSSVANFLSLFLLISGYCFNYDNRVKAFRQSELRLLELRDKYAYLIYRLNQNFSHSDDLICEYENLSGLVHSVYKEIPQTSRRAYKKACKLLKGFDAFYTSKEIERFLPKGKEK